MFNLQDALEAIKNKPEFGVSHRPYGVVIDYNVSMRDTFIGKTPRQTAILQNLRGTIFDHEGRIIRLAYHKFHNLNENDEYAEANFDFKDGNWIEEKLDGSMVTPIGGNDPEWSNRLATRAGNTDVAQKAEEFLQSHVLRDEYHRFFSDCRAVGFTPIFEYVSRNQRIVIDYPQTDLILTGVRSNETGEYIDLQNYLKIPRVPRFFIRDMSIGEYAKVIKNNSGTEGVVVKFTDGRIVKIKTDEYVRQHRAIDGLRFEKDVLKLILNNEVDDVLAIVNDDMKRRLEMYRDQVVTRISMCNSELNELIMKYAVITDRKEFANIIKDSPYRAELFKSRDGKEVNMKNRLFANTSSQTMVDSVRWLIGAKSWYEI